MLYLLLYDSFSIPKCLLHYLSAALYSGWHRNRHSTSLTKSLPYKRLVCDEGPWPRLVCFNLEPSLFLHSYSQCISTQSCPALLFHTDLSWSPGAERLPHPPHTSRASTLHSTTQHSTANNEFRNSLYCKSARAYRQNWQCIRKWKYCTSLYLNLSAFLPFTVHSITPC